MNTLNSLMYIVLGCTLIGLVFAGWLVQWVMAKDTGTPAMRKISDAIKDGAEAFLARQNKTIIYLSILFVFLLFLGYGFIRDHQEFDPVSSSLQLGFWVALSFALGALCSVFAGYVGMWVSIRSNIRTAAAARTSLNDAMQIALRGGAVSGMLVVVMSLLGVAGLFMLVQYVTPNIAIQNIPLLIVGYGFGASFVALFAQVGRWYLYQSS